MTDIIPVFDGHNDFLLRLHLNPAERRALWLERQDGGQMDLPRMREGGFAGGMFAIFVPSPRKADAPNPMAAMEHPPYDVPLPARLDTEWAQPVALSQAGHLLWMARAAPEDFAVCRSVAEIRAAMDRGAIAGVMHMEGAEPIGADLDALHVFHAMGLRSLGPVWSRPTVFGEGAPFRFPGTPDIGAGLTDAGKALVRECNALKVLIDLSHLNEKGFDDVADLSDAPLVATHSNVHALCTSPRNLTDRQLDRIAETGGMVGLNFATFFLREDGRGSPDVPWEVMLRHLDYLIGRLGEDHVGFGSDFDGAIMPAAMRDVSGLQGLIGAMRAHGYNDALLQKLARENWLGVLARTWGG